MFLDFCQKSFGGVLGPLGNACRINLFPGFSQKPPGDNRGPLDDTNSVVLFCVFVGFLGHC